MRRTIAIDFDGCLVEDRWPEIGEPSPEVFRAALREQANGAALILWTCRTGASLDAAVVFCREHGLVFDEINQNTPEALVLYGSDCRKVVADEYWDDRAVTVKAGATARKYTDCFGKEIVAGMLIRIGDDAPERVYACEAQDGKEDLGINASNEEYLKHHPDAEREYYPLSNFPRGIIKIVKATEDLQ